MFAQGFAQQMRWELEDLWGAFRSWRFYRTLAVMVVGIALASVAINGILVPRNLQAPGTSGLTLLLYYAVDRWSLGTLYLVINIPLFLVGWREYALRYVFISSIGVFMYSLMLDLTAGWEIATPDPIMGALLAGVMMGMGSGLYLRFGGSAGGMDIVASFIKKKFALPMGTTLNAVNAFNLAGIWYLFGTDVTLYSGLFMWVNSWTLDRVHAGFSQRQAVFIITTQPDAVAQSVMKRLDRGVTFFHATGGFSHAAEMVVYTVINKMELGRLKELLYELDPDALVVVYATSEVIGSRFLTWEDEGYRRRQYEPTLPA